MAFGREGSSGRMGGPEGTLDYNDPTAGQPESVEENIAEAAEAATIKNLLANPDSVKAKQLPVVKQLIGSLGDRIGKARLQKNYGDMAIDAWQQQREGLQAIADRIEQEQQDSPGLFGKLKRRFL